MSLDYDLYTGAGLSEGELLGFIRHRMGFKLSKKEFEGPGLTGVVFEVHAVRNAILDEDLKMRMELCTGMRIDLSAHDPKKGHHGIETAARLSLDICKKGTFDVLLLFNGDTPFLIRRTGRLHLQRSFWSAMDRLSLVDVPHTLEDLPGL
ncbi:MAG: hypothetical protein HZB91_13455 [Elusimicrobia bacterium]|nr:hypothetical protein [Elusimicrobiota bacterium]